MLIFNCQIIPTLKRKKVSDYLRSLQSNNNAGHDQQIEKEVKLQLESLCKMEEMYCHQRSYMG